MAEVEMQIDNSAKIEMQMDNVTIEESRHPPNVTAVQGRVESSRHNRGGFGAPNPHAPWEVDMDFYPGFLNTIPTSDVGRGDVAAEEWKRGNTESGMDDDVA